MNTPVRAIGVGLVLAISALLYAPYLGYSPPHLGWDEVFFALNAHAIATTARDVHGRFLPLYFQFSTNAWFQPMIVYFTALFFKVLPVSETTIRLPTVVMGLIDIVLMYFVARRLFKRELLAGTAAGLLALTPAHFIHSRLAMDYLYPVPFILAWLLCLLTAVDLRRPWLIFAGTACLGFGFYSYLAAVVMMPLYVLLTWVTLLQTDAKPKALYVAATIGFVLPVLCVIPWLLQHPTAYAGQVARYRVYDATKLNPLQGLKEFLNYTSVTERVMLYWDYFNPSYLFFAGASKLAMSTRRVGVFLLPLAVFLPVGLYRMMITHRTWRSWLVLAGFASAPAAALLVDEAYAIDRELEVLPFAVLIATFGIEQLLSASRKWVRIAGVCLLALVPVQFGYFYHDYFTDYRARSFTWFERNIRGGLEEILARVQQGPTPAVYLNSDIGNIESFWRLYLIKHNRADLLARTVYFNPKSLDSRSIPAGSILMSTVDDAGAQALVGSGELRAVKVIDEPNDTTTFLILER